MTRQAVLARSAPVAAARTAKAEDDSVANAHEAFRARTELLDNTNPLVAKGHRATHAGPVALTNVKVGVAHPRRGDPHQRMIHFKRGDRLVADEEVSRLKSCRLHRSPPSLSTP